MVIPNIKTTVGQYFMGLDLTIMILTSDNVTYDVYREIAGNAAL